MDTNRPDLRAEFLENDDEGSEVFELPNGTEFLMEPITVQDAIDLEENQEALLDPDKENKSNIEMTFELITRRTYDKNGDEKLFGKRDISLLMDQPFRCDAIQTLIKAFNEINQDAEITEDGTTEVSDVSDGGEGKK